MNTTTKDDPRATIASLIEQASDARRDAANASTPHTALRHLQQCRSLLADAIGLLARIAQDEEAPTVKGYLVELIAEVDGALSQLKEGSTHAN